MNEHDLQSERLVVLEQRQLEVLRRLEVIEKSIVNGRNYLMKLVFVLLIAVCFQLLHSLGITDLVSFLKGTKPT